MNRMPYWRLLAYAMLCGVGISHNMTFKIKNAP